MISRSLPDAERLKVVATPREALGYLAAKGFETALIGGGAQLDASFLSEGFVDEVVLRGADRKQQGDHPLQGRSRRC